MKIIDNRLLDAKSEQQLIENFNRTLGIIDTLADVVSNIDDSQLFKISFNSDGHGIIPAQYVVEGEKAEKPEDLVPDLGYEFDGWYDGETKFDFNTPIEKHYNLKAKFTAIEYTITYDYKGGTPSAPNPTSYTVSTPNFVINPPIPPSEDLVFTGWTGYSDDVIEIPQGSTGNLVFEANFASSSSEYNITYHLGEGHFPQGTTVPYTYTPNDLPLTLPIPVSNDENEKFDVWMDEYYTERYVVLEAGTTGDIDLYATYAYSTPED